MIHNMNLCSQCLYILISKCINTNDDVLCVIHVKDTKTLTFAPINAFC